MEQINQGEVYLIQLNPSKKNETGKLRPCVILTANRILKHSATNLFICPLSSKSNSAFKTLHLELLPRDKLKATSYAIVEQTRAISNKRIIGPRIASLNHAEFKKIIHRLTTMINPKPEGLVYA